MRTPTTFHGKTDIEAEKFPHNFQFEFEASRDLKEKAVRWAVEGSDV